MRAQHEGRSGSPRGKRPEIRHKRAGLGGDEPPGPSPSGPPRRRDDSASASPPTAVVERNRQGAAGAQVRSGFAGIVGEEGDLYAVVELELLEHARDVRLDGGDAHVQLAADLGV